jgi:DNA-binding transcriptional ArsR family regulator
MTVFTMGEASALALGRVRIRPPAPSGAPHRTGAPVRRDSIEAGSFEHLFFTVPEKGEPDRLLRTARAALDAGRSLKRAARAEGRELSAAERSLAALTAGAVRVYEEICTLARLNRGRVFPSYDHLTRVTSLGRATVARALAVLEAAGFLVRQRRFRRVEAEGPGPRYKQTSNVYRAVLPARVAALLPRWLRPSPVPLPDDAAQLEADRASELATMRAGLSCSEFAQATVGGPLGRVLAKLGAALDRAQKIPQCESQNEAEPLTPFNITLPMHSSLNLPLSRQVESGGFAAAVLQGEHAGSAIPASNRVDVSTSGHEKD